MDATAPQRRSAAAKDLLERMEIEGSALLVAFAVSFVVSVISLFTVQRSQFLGLLDQIQASLSWR